MKSNGVRYAEQQKSAARSLRSSGVSINKIAARLGISRSTAHHWVSSLEITEEQRAVLRENSRRAGIANGPRYRERFNSQSQQWLIEAGELWEKYRHDPLFLLGLGLYWGEGSKQGTRELVLTNSCPALLRAWVTWCKRYLPGDLCLYLYLYVHEDVNPDEAINYWREQLGLEARCLFKASPISSKGRRPKRRLPYGTARIRLSVGSAEWFAKSLEWLRLLQEDAGFV
jgi:hypothetical protein